LITLTTQALNQEKPPTLSNKHTNWNHFRLLVNKRLTLKVRLKAEEDIEAAVKQQWAGRNATLEHIAISKANNCPILIKQKIEERRLRRNWHRIHSPESKSLFNAATHGLKHIFSNNKNYRIQTFL
jgi:hypothetical protein